MGIFYKGVFAQNGSGPSPVTGDFVPQLKTIPTADEAHLGWIVQYAGETTEDYTNGYFYRCDASHTLPPTYAWVRIDVQPAGSNAAFKPFPDDFNLTSGDYLTFEQFVSNIRHSSGAGCGNAYVGEIFDYCLPWLGEGNAECTVVYITDEEAVLTVSSSDILPYYWTYNTASSLGSTPDYKWKSSILQVSTMPSRAIQDTIVQYVGATTSDYTHGYFYKCNVIPGTPKTYEWVQTDVQPKGDTSYTAGTAIDITNKTISAKQMVAPQSGSEVRKTKSTFTNVTEFRDFSINKMIFNSDASSCTSGSFTIIAPNGIKFILNTSKGQFYFADDNASGSSYTFWLTNGWKPSSKLTISDVEVSWDLDTHTISFSSPVQFKSTSGWNALLDGIEFVSGTPSINGESGIVPAPLLGDENKFLKGNGTWAALEPTVIENGPTTIDVAANTIYKFGEITDLTVNSVENSNKEILIYFTAGSNMTISFPNTLNWVYGDNIADNLLSGEKYIISIVNNIAIYATY